MEGVYLTGGGGGVGKGWAGEKWRLVWLREGMVELSKRVNVTKGQNYF